MNVFNNKTLVPLGDCCELQVDKYAINGLDNKDMSPQAYFNLISDYTNDTKPLNNIAVSLNVTSVQFGLLHFVIWELGLRSLKKVYSFEAFKIIFLLNEYSRIFGLPSTLLRLKPKSNSTGLFSYMESV